MYMFTCTYEKPRKLHSLELYKSTVYIKKKMVACINVQEEFFSERVVILVAGKRFGK